MKKKLLLLLLFILFVYFCFQLPKYRFGYFKKGPTFDVCKSSYEFIELDDGNILLLGRNDHVSPYSNRWTYDDLVIKEEISYLYNIETNKFEEFKLPNDIAYHNEGIYLKNNKLLLTYAYNPNGGIKYSEYYDYENPPFVYDSMAVVDLKTKKVEKMLQKKINKRIMPNENYTTFTLLDNGKVLIIDFDHKLAEIYNPETNTSKLLNVRIDKYAGGHVVATKGGKALIFGQTILTKKQFDLLENYVDTKVEKYAPVFYSTKDTVEEYDDATETIKPVGSVFRRDFPSVVKVNEDKLVIFGGDLGMPGYSTGDIREIEVYDIPTNTSKIVGVSRKARKTHNFGVSSTGVPINDRYFLLTGGYDGNYGVYTWSTKMSEIIDLKAERVYVGPNLPLDAYWPLSFRLKNGKSLILNRGEKKDSCTVESRFFVPRKGLKNE